jgi:molybdopterin/thiamine biosynthesis adenylyltransferase
MRPEIRELIQMNSRETEDPARRAVRVLDDIHAEKIAQTCGCTVHEVYTEAMRLGTLPYRYLRNGDTISLDEQLKLAESQVSVVGAGGLGGQVLLLLARVGIGHLIVVDSDMFDETNLNRQALCSHLSLGRPKVEEAVSVVGSINPGIEITPYHLKIDSSIAQRILAGSHVIVDALDNVPDRFILEKAAKKLWVPLVHGALAGFEGQLMTILPGDTGLKHVYGRRKVRRDDPNSPEAILGVPAITPSIIATLQAMEVLKIILRRGNVFRNTMVHVDVESGELNKFTFRGTNPVNRKNP